MKLKHLFNTPPFISLLYRRGGLGRSTKKIKLRTYISFGLIAILLPIAIAAAFRPSPADAGWFDQGYGFRKPFSFTHNAALTDRRVQVTVDTATLISASKMQSDCDDSRFTDINGKLLRYQLTGTCNNASTTYDVLFPTIINGLNTGYFYYGNPSALSGSENISSYTSLSPSGGSPSFTSEEVGQSPIAYWNLDDAQGATAQDQTSNNKDGSISGATWQTESQCISGKCLFFDGSNDVMTVASTVNNIQTVSFWAKVNSISTTEQLIDLNGTDYIQSVSGTITANSFGAETVYINGRPGTTITANTWNHIEVTTPSGLTGSGIKLAQVSTNYGQVYLDEIKLYGYARTAAQVLVDYNMGALVLGISDQSYLSDGLVGYWKMDETSGDAVDSGGNGLTLTNNGTAAFGAGKFGNAPTFNGSSKYFSTATTISAIQTVAFWTKPANTSDNFINLITGTAYVASSSGTVSATGFTGANVYVNGNLNGTLTANVWNHVVVTSTTGINANAFNIGRSNGNYAVNNSQIDSIRLYSRVLPGAEVSSLYNWAPGPVAYWKFDENTGTTSYDSSSNGLNGTNTNGETSDWAPAKLGSGVKLDGVDEKVSVTDNNTLDITAGVSSMGWVNVTTAGAVVYDTIAHDADSSGSAGNTGSLTFSHTIANQNNRMLLVGVSTEDSVEADQTVSGITYNSVAMSLAKARTQAATTNRRAELWYLAAPDVGTHDIVVTFGGTTTSIAAGSTSLYNVAQQAPEATGEAGTGNGTSTTVNITTLTDNAWVVDSAMNGSTGGFSQPGDQVERWDVSGPGHQGGGSTKVVASHGATSVQETNSGGSSGASHVAAAFAPSSTVSAATLIGKGNDAYNLTLSSVLTITATINTSNTTTATLTAGWHHIAMTYDGATLRLYLDGIQQNSAAATGAIGTNATDLTIGQYINGVIDDFKIYNYGRSNNQIIEDMNGTHPLGGSPIGSQTTYWKLDEQQGTTANNSISGNTNGTISNALWKTKTNCKVNGCLLFDGTGDVVTIATASDSNVDFNGSEPFSGSAWVYVTTMPGSGEQDAIVAKWDATTPTRGYRLFVENDDADSTGNFQVDIYDESTDQTITATTSNDTVSQNTWYHVAFSFNGGTAGAAGDLKLYVNGQQFANSANASFLGLEDVTADFTVGEYDATDVVSTNTGFSGYIDEVKIYSSELTNSQVLIDMNAGASNNFGTTASDEAGLLADGAGNPPVMFWNLNENTGTNATDTSGNGNDGTLTNTPTWTPGKYGSAVKFAGSNQHITRADDPDLDFAASSSFTIGTWFKHNTASATQTLVSKIESSGTDGGYKLKMESDGDITCETDDDDADTTIDDTATTTAATYDDNNWHYVACVYDTTNTDLLIYIDGSLTASDTTTTTNSLANDDAFFYGIEAATGTEDWIGVLDELKVYNYARTAAQVAYDYNRGAPIGWWKFDENTATVVNDSSGNAINGTLNESTFVEGKYSSGVLFDSETDDITFSSTNINSTIGSFSFWYKPTNNYASTDTRVQLFGRGNGAANDFYLLSDSGDFYAGINAGTDQFISVNSATISPYWVANTWVYFTVVYDIPNKDLFLYANSKLISSNTNLSSWTTWTPPSTWYIGSKDGSSWDGEGVIDDFKIYNYLLSSTQIKKLYNENASVRFGPAQGTP